MEDHDQQREVHNYIRFLMETTSMEKKRENTRTYKKRKNVHIIFGVCLSYSITFFLPSNFLFSCFSLSNKAILKMVGESMGNFLGVGVEVSAFFP